MSDKYVREIEEILEGVEPNGDPKAKLSKRRSAPMESQRLIPNGFSVRIREFIKITPKRLILLGIVVLVVAMILKLVILRLKFLKLTLHFTLKTTKNCLV